MMRLFIVILCVACVKCNIGVAPEDDISNNISNSITDHKPVETIISDNPVTKNESIDTNIVPPTDATQKETSNNTISDNTEPLTEDDKIDNGVPLLLTQYLKTGKAKQARLASKVDSKYFLGFKSYSGFLTVDERYNSNLFFWYFPSLTGDVPNTPWLIWLQGGPGASSLIGLFQEHGPFSSNNGTLRPNPYTWLQNHSLLFIDNPVGTGYSFTEHEDGYATSMYTYSNHLYSAVHQFLQIFPELRQAPLFIAGESYAGKYVPALAMEIHRRKENSASTPSQQINLQGVILGNAYVDPDMITQVPLAYYYFGLLGKEQLQILQPVVDSFLENIHSNNSVGAKNKWVTLISLLLFITHQKHGYNFLQDQIPLGDYKPFLNTTGVPRALHVGSLPYWTINVTANERLAPEFLTSTKPLLETLLEHYRVLVYCGQLDLMLPCVFASENYRKWRWNGSLEFLEAARYPYIHGGRLWGYHKSGGNLTEVMIRGAGHMVPMDAPGPARNMIARWTRGLPISLRYGQYNGSFVEEYVKNYTSTVFV